MNIIIRLIFLLSLNLLSYNNDAQTKVIPYQQLPNYNGIGNSGIYFSASMTTASITVTFEGPADRWIALGFGTSMFTTDVLTYSNGKSGSIHTLDWKDYYNTSTLISGVNLDVNQNWNIISTNTLSTGQRTVTATRALSTGDSQDIVISFSASNLNLVWARGASANYTLAYHGSTNRAYNISLPWLSSPTASFTSSSQSICAGSSVIFSNQSTGGGSTYNWSFQGGSPASSTATNPVVSYTAPGTYSVVLTASNSVGTSTFSQLNYVTVSPTVLPGASISIISGINPLCAGSSVTFSCTSLNGGSSPFFQWKLNGINVGSNSSTYSSSSLSNLNSITCQLTSNMACATPSNTLSSAITVTVNSTAPSSLSINQNIGSNPMCIGSVAGFSAVPFQEGTNPVYQWKINGVNTGLNSPTFTTNTLNSGDIVTCQLVSSDPCTSNSVALSSGITLTVSTNLIPTLTLSLIPAGAPICSGQSATFTVSNSNGGNTPSYQWQVNANTSGGNSSSFTSASLLNGDIVSCTLTSALTCANPQTVSVQYTAIVIPTPQAPTINVQGSNTVCPGNSVTLNSSISTNNLWSNGSNNSFINVTAVGQYSVQQVVNGCLSSPALITIYNHNLAPTLLDSISTQCLDNLSVPLNGIPAGGNYFGSGVIGNLFSPSLAVIGNNTIFYVSVQSFGSESCSDTTSIEVQVEECTGIHSHSNQILYSLYPNPVKNYFKVAGPSTDLKFQLYNQLGCELALDLIYKEGYYEGNLADYAGGLYILLIQSDQFKQYVRLIKEN